MRSLPNQNDSTPTARLQDEPAPQPAMAIRRKKTGLSLIGWLPIFLILSLTPAVAGAESADSEEALLPLVTVAPVVVQDINPPAEYIGHVEAVQVVDLRARVDGFLEQINFNEGDRVTSGKVLYVIEQAPYLSKVAVDKAQLAQAEAELTRANQHLKRLRSALSASVPAVDLDDAAAAQLRAEAMKAMAQATLDRSLLDLGYTTIKAPISGRIGRTRYTRGNLVGPASNPLARVVQIDPIRVVYSISDSNLAAIQATLKDAVQDQRQPDLIPRLRLGDGTLFEREGRIDFVDNEVDPTTGTIAIRAVFDNPEGFLIPGQYVNVLVTLNQPKPLPVVSQAAVMVNQQGHYVLVVDEKNIARVRPIVIGQAVGTLWAVESGLKAGERVIVEGIQKAQPDEPVKIDPTQPQES